MSEYALIICLLAVAGLGHSELVTTAEAYDTCHLVAETAWNEDVPVELAVALAHAEGGFASWPRATSKQACASGRLRGPVCDHLRKSNAKGPVQALPKWACRGLPYDCDTLLGATRAGLNLLRRFLVRDDWRWASAIAGYTGSAVTGNHGFGRKIINNARWLSESQDCQCTPGR